MSNTANRTELAKACALVRPAIANQPYMPALTHIAFDGKRATAYDDKAAISVKCVVPVQRLVPGAVLIQALASFGGAEVMFQQADDKHLKISSGRANVKLPTLDLDTFPLKWPTDDDSVEVDLDDEVIRGIERCLISVDPDPGHAAAMGVTLDRDDNGKAVLFSTDTRSMSRFQTGTKVKLPGDAPIIMPKFFCEQLVSLRKAFPKEEAYIELRADCLMAYFGDEATLFSRVPVDLQPLDFPSLFTRHVTDDVAKSLMDIPDNLDAALGRAVMVMQSEVAKTTELTCSSKGIELKTESKATNTFADDFCEVNAKAQHGKTVMVDPAFLARGAKATTRMGITDKVVVFADKSVQFVHLIAHVG